MQPVPVIAIFDVGKTNKKLFLFDENYKIVYERSVRFTEVADEDGFPCEDLESLRTFVFDTLNEISGLKELQLKAVNFSTYGASLVFVDKEGNPLTPLYNYLKPFPEGLSRQLYDKYGGKDQFVSTTASPVSGSLNSGLTLYRLKIENPDVFRRLGYALHLPQYLSFLLTGRFYSDITSLGCHTAMWDFNKNKYHEWVEKEGLLNRLAPVLPSDTAFKTIFHNNGYLAGIGLHDSSAALIPYLFSFDEPFVLLSTGTWCISMNPSDHSPLTQSEFQSDCLCYLEYHGKSVKSSRLFAGHEHEQQVKRIAGHFNQDINMFQNMPFDPEIAGKLSQNSSADHFSKESVFKERELSDYADETEAYYQLILDLVHQQSYSTCLVLKGAPVKRIFVDGGFSKNAVYMNLLANAFPGMEVFAASVPQASAIGAAMAIHPAWNNKPLPRNIIKIKYYPLNS